MGQVSEKAKKIEEVALSLLGGILANPNYNFNNVKQAVAHSIEHAQEFVVKIAEKVESFAKEVANVADKIGDKARGSDDDVPVVPAAKPVEEAKKDPLSDI